MIKKLLIAIVPLGLLVVLTGSMMDDNGKAGRTGSPNENPCTTSCHNTYALNSGPGSISIQSQGMTNFVYTPGQVYAMSVTVSQTGVGLFGVGIEALTSTNNNAGTLTITDAASTQIKTATVSGISRRNIVHKLNGGLSSNSKVFNFSWTAPAAGTGNVTFYFAGNASNSSGTDAGDYIYTGSQVITEACVTPAQPGTVTGNATVCSGGMETYSITAVAGATGYTWTLPSGWSGTSTTESISVTAGSTSGDITVTVDNACGSSTPATLTITVNTVPAQPGSIFGSNAVCANSQHTYNISPVAGASSYSWTLPGDWTGTSTSESISVTAGVMSGDVMVTANNGCGASQFTTLTVTNNPLPQPVIDINSSTGTDTLYTTLSGIGYQWYYNGSAITGATYSMYEPTQNGNYVVEVTDANGCTGSSQIFSLLNLGVNQLKGSGSMSIKWNSATGKLFVNANDKAVSSVSIVDYSGKVILNSKLDNAGEEIDLNALPDGVYFAVANNGSVNRFVITR